MLGDVCSLTSKELDRLPSYLSGLPTHPTLRAEALEAWKAGGPKALNDWRQERIERTRKKGKHVMKAGAVIMQ